jgi:spermidine synthase
MSGQIVKAGEWFHETNAMWPGQAFSLEVQEVLHQERTEYQDLVVFKNNGPWGNVMLLDGCVQVTDKDEFVYHEMMAHMPLCTHPNPKTVLIVGGGDGGVMREVVKHPSVVNTQEPKQMRILTMPTSFVYASSTGNANAYL